MLKEVHRVIKFHQNAWLKPYTDTNTDIWKKAKYDFETYSFKLSNNAIFKKQIEHVRKHKDNKLFTRKKRNISNKSQIIML